MTRELYCQCANLDCGHTFVSLVEVVRTLSRVASQTPTLPDSWQVARPTRCRPQIKLRSNHFPPS
ncbi:ogr/Delta-like zinc finger family protein [Cupriavidus pauculus]